MSNRSSYRPKQTPEEFARLLATLRDGIAADNALRREMAQREAEQAGQALLDARLAARRERPEPEFSI